MNPQILKQIEVAATHTEAEQRKLRTLVWSFRFAGLLGVFISALLMKTAYVTTLAGGLISAAGGLAVGLSIYFKLALEQTPILMKYVDIESIKKRLSEINP